MSWRIRFVATFFISLSLTAGVSATDGIYLTTASGIQITTDATGKSIPAVTLKSPYYRVVAGKAGQLTIRQNGVGLLLDKTKVVALDDAVDYFSARIAADPTNAFNWARRALAWELQGELDKALRDHNRAVAQAPTVAAWLNNRGQCYYLKKEYQRAIDDFEEALRYDPNFVLAYTNAGLCWEARGKFDKALAAYYQATRRGPNDPHGFNALAFLLATCPAEDYRNGPVAFEFAITAWQLSSLDDSRSLDTLAAALARCKEYETAAQAEALALDDPMLDDSVKADYKLRLSFYKQRKAYISRPNAK